MKLAIAVLLFALAIPGAARADIIHPPGGPVYVDDDGGPPRAAPSRIDGDRPQRPRRMRQGQRPRDPQAAMRRQRLRQALLSQFDANGDGRLGPRERMRAIRTLRMIERRLAAPMQRGNRANRAGRVGPDARRARKDRAYRQFMRRYDVNGDGVVGPREVPRGAADRLRRFDRDGDGWVDRDELP